MSKVKSQRAERVARDKPEGPCRIKEKRLGQVSVPPGYATIFEGDGWRFRTSGDRVFLDGPGGQSCGGCPFDAMKTCQIIELWDVPFDEISPADGYYQEIRFVEPGEQIKCAMELWGDGCCWLHTRLAGGGCRCQASMRTPIPSSIGEALLRQLFPGVVIPSWRAPLAKLIAAAKDFEERARPILQALPELKGDGPDEVQLMLDDSPVWFWDLYNELNRLGVYKQERGSKVNSKSKPKAAKVA